jgi:chaperonin GroES
MDLRPLHDHILVKRLEDSGQVSGSILIPDTAKDKPQRAQVLAVGNGKLMSNGERVAVEVKPGDEVLFGKYSGAEIKVAGEDCLVLREDEILGVVE